MKSPLVSFMVRALIVSLLGLIPWLLRNPRFFSEHKHGILLPTSAENIQYRGDLSAWLPKQCISTLFVMDQGEVLAFEKQLQITERNLPAIAEGDPLINGWNVWPESAPTFIPGNHEFAGFEKTWHGNAKPIEMISCGSTVGFSLHIEYWQLTGNKRLVKLYTEHLD